MQTRFYLAKGTDSELAKKIRELIGVNDFEDVEVQTPQFDRTDGKRPFYYPKTVEEYDKLKECPKDLLIEMCCSIWEKNNKTEHWLFPGEWYDWIPDNYPIVDIFGNIEKFKYGETDDDTRYGCLPYGFIRKKSV